MGTPYETTNEVQPETAAVPAKPNTRNVVDLSGLDSGLVLIEERLTGLESAPLVKVVGSIAELRNIVTDIRKQVAAAAVETSTRVAVAKVEITGEAPAIIVRRSIGEAISRGNLRPGQKLPGQDIVLVTAWEPTNRAGERLGRKLASFGAPENLPSNPRTFNQNVAAIANLENWHDHNGWKFDRLRYGTSSYEDGRFKGYRDGSAIGTWGSPELPILNGKDRDGKPVAPAENMLVLSRDKKSACYKTFVMFRGFHYAKWSQSCTEHRDNPDYAHAVHFPDGKVLWDHNDNDTNRSCVRPVVALELSHLIL
jgi:hypothetical protein